METPNKNSEESDDDIEICEYCGGELGDRMIGDESGKRCGDCGRVSMK